MSGGAGVMLFPSLGLNAWTRVESDERYLRTFPGSGVEQVAEGEMAFRDANSVYHYLEVSSDNSACDMFVYSGIAAPVFNDVYLGLYVANPDYTPGPGYAAIYMGGNGLEEVSLDVYGPGTYKFSPNFFAFGAGPRYPFAAYLDQTKALMNWAFFGDPGAASFGAGSGIVFLPNRAALPGVNPVGGGFFYAQGGALVWHGSAGTITPIAPA